MRMMVSLSFLRLRTDDVVHQAIHRHYDSFPHAQSGWVLKTNPPTSLLCNGFGF